MKNYIFNRRNPQKEFAKAGKTGGSDESVIEHGQWGGHSLFALSAELSKPVEVPDVEAAAFKALRWADEKCRKNPIECSAANRRAALGPALFKIRFPLITLKTFAKEIVPSGILTLEEVIRVYQ
ncbi:hypothetical protein niasHT_010369 [Heterodera trifolii]|uniref:Uncharacterized protein n=1 Tax=Heterodera trifolii TaxID=157864 RepID=A0ABD2MBC4_9BILA